MTSSLLALMTPADGSSGSFPWPLLQIPAIVAVFYFLVMRPQSQARKKHEVLLAGLKKGDEITTSGGIIGKVKDVKDTRVTIESGESVLVVDRSRIVRVGDTTAPGTAG